MTPSWHTPHSAATPPWARLLLGALLYLSVFGSGAAAQEPLSIVVSISPYEDLTRRVAGELATVTTLLPPGASPHAFDPTPAQAAQLTEADLVIMNGGVDGWLTRLLQATAGDSALLVLMEAVEFEKIEEGPHINGRVNGEGAEGSAQEAPVNPHIWLDPSIAANVVRAVAAALTDLAPAHAKEFEERAEAVQRELAELDARVGEILAPVRGAAFVPFHDAWVYFAHRYGLEIVVTLEPFPGREPSARYVAGAVSAIRAAAAPVIFTEPQLGTRSAEVVAESAGVGVALIDPLGGTPGLMTYEELLLTNARRIAEALR